MDKEEAKKYLFVRIPALVQCNPNAKYAYVMRFSCQYIVKSMMEKPKGDSFLAWMEIPRDNDGELDLLFYTVGQEGLLKLSYFDKSSHYPYKTKFHQYQEIRPFYPEEKPKMVDWEIEDFTCGHSIKFKCRNEEILITRVNKELKTINLADSYSCRDLDNIFGEFCQLDGTPFQKEAGE